MKKFIVPLAALAILAGCSKSESSAESATESATTPTFTSKITRVTGTWWDEDDAIGIMPTQNNSLVTINMPYNAKYNVDYSDGTFTPDTADDTIYYPLDEDESIDFYAYSPYRLGLDDDDQNIELSVTDQSKPADIDFMEASTRTSAPDGYNKESDEVELQFNRRLSKLTLNLIAGDGESLDYITSLELTGLCTKVVYDFTDCSFETPSTTASITMHKESTSQYTAILIPNVDSDVDATAIYTPTTPLLTVHTTLGETENLEWDFTNTEGELYKLSAGDNSIFSVTVTRTRINVSSTDVITDWGNGSGGSVTAD